MDDLSPRLKELGAGVARVSDRGADPGAIDAARRRFMAPAAPRRRPRPLHLAIAAALCLVALVALAAWPPRAAVSFELGAPPVRGTVGEWVAAGAADPLGVRFSEGTRLTLDPGARMRVTKTSARGAEVLIERGSLRAAVVHAGDDTRWAVHAGPFEVRVTGTAFDAGWDPATETFDLLMREGTVSVSGPLLPPGRVLIAGEHLVISVHEGLLELKTASAAVRSPSSPIPPTPALPPDLGGKGASPQLAEVDQHSASKPPSPPNGGEGTGIGGWQAGPTSGGPIKPGEPTWQDLSAAGKHRDALAIVEQRGFTAEIGRASAGELLALSDTARFAGRPDRAREALLALRRRFGKMGHSAFLLGKIAADQQGADTDAAAWFETSLAEEPGGALAEQALGRILEIKKRHDREAARSVAARYLQKYPGGAYAALARSVLSP